MIRIDFDPVDRNNFVLVEKTIEINFGSADIASGGGDMYKVQYDGDNSGVVDDSEKLGGELPAEYKKFSSLSDKDSIEQDATSLGDISGAVVFDMTKNFVEGTMIGDITGVSFSNNPTTNKKGTWLIRLKQDVGGSRVINWVGSGIIPEEGKTSDDYQPLITGDAYTNFWMLWNGSAWEISKDERSIIAL